MTVVTTRNSISTIKIVIDYLLNNNIDVFIIDNQSTDGTKEFLEKYSQSGALKLSHTPFDGVFSLKQQLLAKIDVFKSNPSDWYIHLDADEILESFDQGQTLREFITQADQSNYDVIDCDEFVFIPEDENIDYAQSDFHTQMKYYYYFAPQGRSLHRCFKAHIDFRELVNTGGHKLDINRYKISPKKLRLRHYMGLSYNHLRAQYLSRVFDADELRKGFHRNRVATTPQFIAKCPIAKLSHLAKDGWRTERPFSTHPIFNQPRPYSPPSILNTSTQHFPMPFIVGVGRSGTTLLRLLIDAHPDIAITPETHWLSSAIDCFQKTNVDIDRLINTLKSNAYWPEMQISDDDLQKVKLTDASNTLRGIYSLYAKKYGKTKYGDKTPIHGLMMTKIAQIFPEAFFIHIIRDGRDVAVSYREMWFGPGKNVTNAAIFWTWRIREMRQQAEFLPNYLEIKYEDLVLDPESVLKKVGNFINLPFHSDQLLSYLNADKRLSELVEVQHGNERISAEKRRSIFSEVSKPPNSSRIKRWQKEMTLKDISEFESIAGTMLADLGYDL